MICLAATALCGDVKLTGRVTRVYDGDTLLVDLPKLPKEADIRAIMTVQDQKSKDGGTTIYEGKTRRMLKIRLYGIDAPEKGQDFSNKARDYLKLMTMGEEVTIISDGSISYDRLVGKIFVFDHYSAVEGKVYKDVSLAMLKAGLAWHYARFCNLKDYARAQQEAKAQRKGLWSIPDPVPPWNFRRSTRGKSGK